MRIDSLFFNSDGTIRKVTPTLRGVGVTLATSKIHLDRYSNISESGASIAFLNKENPFEGWKIQLNENGWVRYNRVDFGDGNQKKVTVRVSSVSDSKLRLQSVYPENRMLAEIKVVAGDSWQEISVPLQLVPKGIHDIELWFVEGEIAEIDWISFE